MMRRIFIALAALLLSIVASAQEQFISFDLRDDGRLEVTVPSRLLGHELLVGTTISSITDNRFASVGEKPRQPMVFFFEVAGNRLQVCRRRYDLETSDDNIAESIRRNSIHGVLSSWEIKSWAADSTSLVSDMTDFFLGVGGEMNPFADRDPNAKVQVTQNFRRENSSISGVRNFSDNASVRCMLNYSVSMRNNAEKKVYMTDSPFNVEVTRSIIELPEEPMPLRYADRRIGVFTFSRSRFSGANAWVDQVEYVRRWNLDRGPVTFYLDPSFPESWKPWIVEGVQRWNKAFEAAGLGKVITVLPYPEDDPEFDPDNLKYNCIRYSPSVSTNAMGPFWYDPRSGEILCASINVYHNVVRLVQQWRFIQTSQCDERVRTTVLPEEILGESIAYVVSHEMGHCLGLMHNMAGSSGIPVESLRDPSFTSEYGTTYSIMDYARFNYVAQPGDKVRMTPPDLGVYDMYAIDWLYGRLDGTPEQQKVAAEAKIDSHAGDLRYRYGKQQMSSVSDPGSISEDLGDDPLKASQYGIENLRYIASNMDSWLADEDRDLAFRSAIYKEIVSQYQQYISACLYNIGGIYVDEDLVNGRRTPVPAEKQKASLEFVLGQSRDLGWFDTPSMRMLRKDPGDLSVTMGASLLRTSLARLSNVNACSALAGEDAYTREEFLRDIFDFVWKPTREGATLAPVEMEQQNQYVLWLSGKDCPQELAWNLMQESRKILKKKASTGSAATKAHYAYLLDRLSRQLDR